MPSEKPLSQKALVSKSPWIRAQIDRTLVRFYGCIKNKLVLDSMTDSLLARTKGRVPIPLLSISLKYPTCLVARVSRGAEIYKA